MKKLIIGNRCFLILVLAVLFSSLRVGALALIPNALPVAAYFGLLGLTGITLNATTGLVACMVLGIAVDDTIHFLVRFNEAFAKNFQDIDAGADAALESYGWPGNIRELRNVIESAVLLEDGPLLATEHLRLEATESDRPELPTLVHDALVKPLPAEGVDLLALIAQIEEALLRKAYTAAGGNQTRAAQLLGLNRDKLRYRLKMYDIV